MTITDIQQQTRDMIDDLKAICTNYGLGNASSEYKIITEVFLYKYLNDKFISESRKADPSFESLPAKEIEEKLSSMNSEEYEFFLLDFQPDTAKLQPNQFISALFNRQGEDHFHKVFDDTLVDIATSNIDVFSVQTGGQSRIRLFDPVSQYITDFDNKDKFCAAIIDKLAKCSFESVFQQKYDFFSTVFEYLIKDYNKDFGKYAEYYTPHAIAAIIAEILVPDGVSNVTAYDPAAGSGTLLLALAHQIGESNCSIYAQDISQKSNEFLRLNLILNNLVHSLPNIVYANTLDNPRHLNKKKDGLGKFDYVVSNPPFNVDFSEIRDALAGEKYRSRFFAGVPNVPDKKKEKMPIYLMFIQHIITSMNETGKAAIVVPTGFLTAGTGIPKAIKEHLVKEKMLRGVISMPSNVFANTGTNVSVLFLDKSADDKQILLMDASKLGETVKEGNTQKTLLSKEDITHIIQTFRENKQVDDLSVVVGYDDLAKKKNSLSAGQYFEVKIDYVELTPEEFQAKMTGHQEKLASFFSESEKLQGELMEQLEKVKYE